LRVTRREAEELRLTLYRLLTWDFDAGNPRRTKVGEVVTHLVYSLDDLQVSTKVHARTLDSVPPPTLDCAQTGVPLRPVYISDGYVRRAVPISWNEGVDYAKWRSLQEDS